MTDSVATTSLSEDYGANNAILNDIVIPQVPLHSRNLFLNFRKKFDRFSKSCAEITSFNVAQAPSLCEYFKLSTPFLKYFIKARILYCRHLKSYGGENTPKGRSIIVSEVLKLFMELWERLALLCPTHDNQPHPFFVPPIYQNAVVYKILERFCTSLLERETVHDCHTTGNLILSGVEGTGKTTLTKAMVIATMICSPTYFIIYHDCKVEGVISVSDLVKEIRYRLDNDNYTSRVSIDQNDTTYCEIMINELCQKYGFWVGFAVDEVQLIYDKCHLSSAELRSFENYARTIAKGLIILTGSSANLRSVLLQNKPLHNGMTVDFNRSLCLCYNVPALRNINDLRVYMSKRYAAALSDEWLMRLLYGTGGIGRNIHDAYSTSNMASIGDSKYDDILALFRDSGSAFFLIVGMILQYNSDAVDELRQHWNGAPLKFEKSFGVEKYIVVDVLRGADFSDPFSVLDHLIDCGAIYINHEENCEMVEISIPCYLRKLLGETDVADISRIGSIVSSLYRKIGVNAGTAFQDLVRARIDKLDIFSFCGVRSGYKGIVFKGQEVFIRKNDDTDEKIIDVTLLTHAFWKWISENGLDGFEINETNEGNTLKYIINAWKSKSGFVEDQVDVGKGFDKWRAKYMDTNQVSAFDETASAILVNAEIGLVKICLLLSAAFPTLCFEVGTLLFTTTKFATLAKAFMTKQNKDHIYSVDEKIVKHLKSRLGLEVTFPATFKYKVLIQDGDKWFRDILEESLESLLPRPHQG